MRLLTVGQHLFYRYRVRTCLPMGERYHREEQGGGKRMEEREREKERDRERETDRQREQTRGSRERISNQSSPYLGRLHKYNKIARIPRNRYHSH